MTGPRPSSRPRRPTTGRNTLNTCHSIASPQSLNHATASPPLSALQGHERRGLMTCRNDATRRLSVADQLSCFMPAITVAEPRNARLAVGKGLLVPVMQGLPAMKSADRLRPNMRPKSPIRWMLTMFNCIALPSRRSAPRTVLAEFRAKARPRKKGIFCRDIVSYHDQRRRAN